MKKILYLGLQSPLDTEGISWIHYPMIEIVPRSFTEKQLQDAFLLLPKATHLIVTSKQAALLFHQAATYFHYPLHELHAKITLSVGAKTTETLQTLGIENIVTATNECQEGIQALIQQYVAPHTTLFYAHSSLARDYLSTYIREKGVSLIECTLYDTLFVKPAKQINFNEIDGIFFSSSSTVHSFFHYYRLPHKSFDFFVQGPLTAEALRTKGIDTFLQPQQKGFCYAI